MTAWTGAFTGSSSRWMAPASVSRTTRARWTRIASASPQDLLLGEPRAALREVEAEQRGLGARKAHPLVRLRVLGLGGGGQRGGAGLRDLRRGGARRQAHGGGRVLRRLQDEQGGEQPRPNAPARRRGRRPPPRSCRRRLRSPRGSPGPLARRRACRPPPESESAAIPPTFPRSAAAVARTTTSESASARRARAIAGSPTPSADARPSRTSARAIAGVPGTLANAIACAHSFAASHTRASVRAFAPGSAGRSDRARIAFASSSRPTSASATARASRTRASGSCAARFLSSSFAASVGLAWHDSATVWRASGSVLPAALANAASRSAPSCVAPRRNARSATMRGSVSVRAPRSTASGRDAPLPLATSAFDVSTFKARIAKRRISGSASVATVAAMRVARSGSPPHGASGFERALRRAPPTRQAAPAAARRTSASGSSSAGETASSVRSEPRRPSAFSAARRTAVGIAGARNGRTYPSARGSPSAATEPSAAARTAASVLRIAVQVGEDVRDERLRLGDAGRLQDERQVRAAPAQQLPESLGDALAVADPAQRHDRAPPGLGVGVGLEVRVEAGRVAAHVLDGRDLHPGGGDRCGSGIPRPGGAGRAEEREREGGPTEGAGAGEGGGGHGGVSGAAIVSAGPVRLCVDGGAPLATSHIEVISFRHHATPSRGDPMTAPTARPAPVAPSEERTIRTAPGIPMLLLAAGFLAAAIASFATIAPPDHVSTTRWVHVVGGVLGLLAFALTRAGLLHRGPEPRARARPLRALPRHRARGRHLVDESRSP